MSLIRSPWCHQLCFSDAAVCLWCGQAFELGALERIAIAGEKVFNRRGKELGSIQSPLKAENKI